MVSMLKLLSIASEHPIHEPAGEGGNHSSPVPSDLAHDLNEEPENPVEPTPEPASFRSQFTFEGVDLCTLMGGPDYQSTQFSSILLGLMKSVVRCLFSTAIAGLARADAYFGWQM